MESNDGVALNLKKYKEVPSTNSSECQEVSLYHGKTIHNLREHPVKSASIHCMMQIMYQKWESNEPDFLNEHPEKKTGQKSKFTTPQHQ